MTNKVHGYPQPTTQDPWENYGFGEDFGEDYSKEGPWGTGDEFVGSEGEAGGPYAVKEALAQVEGDLKQVDESIKQIKADKALAHEEKNKALKELLKIRNELKQIQNKLKPLNHKDGGNDPLPAKIASSLSAAEAGLVANTSEPDEEGDLDGEKQESSLKQKIDETKKKIDDLKTKGKLKEEKAQELKNKLDSLLDTAGNTSGKDNGETEESGDDPLAKLEEINQEVDQLSKYSSGAIGLSEIAEGKTPEEIDKLAKKHGIDLSNPPQPPTKEMLGLLQDLSPELKEKIDDVKQKVADRIKFYQDESNAANAQNAQNAASTSDDDNKDMAHFQNLWDLKYHQDAKSKDLMEAMEGVRDDLISLLKGIYGEENVNKVEPASGSGWQVTDNRYKVADQIKVGGIAIDLFNNTSGELQASTTADAESIAPITALFDGEGDGAWPAGIYPNTYGDGSIPATSPYDS